MQYLVIDCETGGFNPETHSLLSTALVKTTSKFQIIKELHVHIRHPIFHVDAEAMEVNHLDLREAKTWSSPTQARKQILDFLGIPQDVETNDSVYAAYTICGMNVQFDVQFLKKFLGELTCQRIFYNRVEEVMSNFRELQKTGIIPAPNGYKLFQLMDALGIEYEADRMHDALYDAQLTAKVAREIQLRGTVLSDALGLYVKKYGGDTASVLECYRHGDKKARLLKLRKSSK